MRHGIREGSSPRVRGSHRALQSQPMPMGIIPAGAGLTRTRLYRPSGPRDHPRGCGAHRPYVVPELSASGSSPRVRGSQIDDTFVVSRLGIIPAGAGLTHHPPHMVKNGRDHPRGCGAHKFHCELLSSIWGSSPRVRGSNSGVTLLRPARDHPRGCGAH